VPALADDVTTLGALGPRVLRVAAAIGLVAMVGAVALGLREGDGLHRFAFAYLINFTFYLSLSLGALFFVAIQHLTRASWSVVVRRIAEVMAANLPLLAVVGIPVLLLATRLFPWASGDTHLPADLMARKAAYLNVPFFVIRWVVFFGIWSAFALYYWRRSLAQDASGDPAITIRMETRSGPALLLYAVTVSLASYDLLMSLDPSWFSTMFGPYFFAGGVVGFHAALTMITYWLQARGRLTTVIHVEHLHDYGKLLFAFVFFWAYLAFSQYMLYWYANIPEETAWLLRRQQDGWQWLGLVLLFGHFLLPFAGLMSRFAKRSRRLVIFWAVWIFVMHWCDLYWVAMPEAGPGGPAPHLLDLACFLGLGGLYVAGLAFLASGRSLVPARDPRLDESLGFENA
jgi:hypothetical protein